MGLYSGFCGCLRRPARDSEEDDADGTEDSLIFKLEELQIATNLFSGLNQLGHGGFGPVYKGLLKNGQEIAVKKLSLNSKQGVTQFINEVKLLLRVQHRNLVMLLGCCAEGPEKMLVYEYLPNLSLDHFLFDKKKSPLLDWTKRFLIVKGIVSGLLYLHEEAPERIIHRDIKASNILLDEHLNPKIADFGLARLFPGEDTHLETSMISGTRGYMAPEYAMHGYLSVKTDVFSFGVLILEIVSGRKNHDGSLGAGKADLVNYAWILFQAGKSLELVDASLQTFNPEEAAMCIHLGLLCCQASVADRPEMNSIQLTLLSNSFTLPRPGKPGVHGRAGRWTTTTNTSDAFTTSTGNASIQTGANKDSEDTGFIDEYSRNSISYSSVDEGR
ncbi:cysteine-rich receptor-like protein kinase 44 [Primulina huaijiensis]|uniref:cysteine-rich receptor-like protein kinase 44 n=1 Tax=Primulina huaijiensis TaxID=1492673 RepID=UPI003CC76E19